MKETNFDYNHTIGIRASTQSNESINKHPNNKEAV